MENKLRKLRRDRVYQAYAEAAQDPAFNADVEDTTCAFDAVTADGLPDLRR